MHKKFDNKVIEKKWQNKWKESGIYDVGERDNSKEKEYVLVELPYPSGNLHIGHWYAFGVPDIYVRFRRMNGKQMLYPMGFDAFGLPAENAAIKRDINPKEWTEGNIEYMKEQLGSMGAAFSWDKTTSTTDPDYYKWTQWMFTEFFKNDLAYHGKGIVNWCPSCNTVIANEQVVVKEQRSECERCGSEIEKKEMPQWMFRITNYADRLIDDLETLNWPEPIKEAQRQWIGRKEGAEISFQLSTGANVNVFTTRPDTLYGATYLVLAPELTPELIQEQSAIKNLNEVEEYITASKQRADQDRLDDTKEKTGVKLEGVTSINPVSGEEIPVYIADYVLASYGTGAIMAVPAHDERDHAFAIKFRIPIKEVVAPYVPLEGVDAPKSDKNIFEFEASTIILKHWKEEKYYIVHFADELFGFPGGSRDEGETPKETAMREATEESGYNDFKSVSYVGAQVSRGYKSRKKREEICNDSGFYIELASDSRIAITDEETMEGSWWTKEEILEHVSVFTHIKAHFLRHLEGGVYTNSGKLINSGEFDGMDSEEAKKAITEKVGGKITNTYRLRDWSVGRQRYWGVPIPIVYDPEGKPHSIPEEHLPWTLPEDVDFRPTGKPPLAKSKELKDRTTKIFGTGWTPEVETMDTFLDSSWYFLRYIDNKNDSCAVSLEKQKDWMPVDLYFGGAEHTTMHLLYSRFWQKALFDLGHVKDNEPYTKRINRSLILGPDGNKMSKSKGNVIDPDEQVSLVGADAVKMYLAFMGPYGETSNYPWDTGGIAGLRRFLERVNGLNEHVSDSDSPEIVKLLHKTILKVTKDIPEYKFNTAISALMIFVNSIEKLGISKKSYETFLILLAPFAPHLTEELWETAGGTSSIHSEKWPEADSELAKDDMVTIGVQINGKMRGTILVSPEATEDEAMGVILGDAQFSARLMEGEIQKIIYIPSKILNLIVS